MQMDRREHTHTHAEETRSHRGVRERIQHMRNTEPGCDPGSKAGVCRGEENKVAER